MAKINGSDFLVYSNGTLIAAQKSCTVTWDVDLPPATTKDGAGWAEHILGLRSATCDFDCLVSTDGLSASGLLDLIISRKNVVLAVDGMGVPIVGEANLKSSSISAPMEEAAGLSGQFIFNGPAWLLTAANAQLNTSWTNVSLDTFTTSGTAVSSAIETTTGYGITNAFAIANTSTYKVITYLTSNSGSLPSVRLVDNAISDISNTVALVAGVNVVTLVTTGADAAGYLAVAAGSASNFTLTKTYIFKI